jgi:RNA polymerase sigma-70 factor (ECF subfamily)
VNEAEAPDDDLSALTAPGADLDARFGSLFERHRPRLERAVGLRIDPALRARIGASDVLQEAWIEARQRLPDYLADPRMPLFLWLRYLALQRLAKAYRFHARAQRRSIRREKPGPAAAGPATSSVVLAEGLAASGVTPSVAVAGAEARARLVAAIEAMPAPDREVLGLRHFEELTNVEVARVLGITAEAASKRYVRALERLGAALGGASSPPERGA